MTTGVGMEAIEGLRFLASFLLTVLGGPKEARKRNLSITSIPVCLYSQFLIPNAVPAVPAVLIYL